MPSFTNMRFSALERRDAGRAATPPRRAKYLLFDFSCYFYFDAAREQRRRRFRLMPAGR